MARLITNRKVLLVWFMRASSAQLTKNPLSTKAREPSKLLEGANGHFLLPNCL